MSRHGEISLLWGDGEYDFRLGYGELVKLQEACDAGPAWIYRRLSDGSWTPQDVHETIRLGLMGHGMKQNDAVLKVRRFVEEAPWMENVLIAKAILSAALVGAPDEVPEGKAKGAAKTKANRSQEERSPSESLSASPP